MTTDTKPNSFLNKMRKGKSQVIKGFNDGIDTGKNMWNGAVDGALKFNEARRRNLEGASGYPSLYSTPIIKQGGKKNRRRKRKTRRRKRKTKRRTKHRRRTSKRRKRRR